jgi:hypothetical protein
MTAALRVATLVAVLLLTGTGIWYVASGYVLDPAHLFLRTAPTSGPVAAGEEYRLTVGCDLGSRFRLGDYLWEFVETREMLPRPPDDLGMPYTVPGTLTLISPTRGVFIPDSDGSRWEVRRSEVYRDQQLGGCL